MGDNYGATIADCVDSKSIETSNREMLDLYDDEDDDENDREFIVNELDGTVDPYVGMEFESEEAAMVYYDAYAKRVGFIIRVGNCHRSGRDGSVISRRFLCNKEGFRVSNKKMKRLEVRKPREITREGCRAMIMVRKDKSGKWIVTKLETEHCHPLGIPTGKGRRGSVQARPQATSGLGVNLEKSEVIQSGWGTIWKGRGRRKDVKCSPDELCSGAAGKVQLKKLKSQAGSLCIYVSDIYPGIIAVQHTAGQIGMFHIFIILQPAYLKLIFFTSLIMIVIPSKLGLMLLVSMKIDIQGTSSSSPATLDEKDKKIRELSSELHRANQQLAECREQLEMVLKDIERHTNHLTKSVQDIVENVKEVEAEDEEQLYDYALSISWMVRWIVEFIDLRNLCCDICKLVHELSDHLNYIQRAASILSQLVFTFPK
ncbi:Protein FAR1-related sequence 7 [Vitis vinifera]|uniref:Protein FAR1-related sequence 7 n=1 Tax=Vitis vinifera TaxID=29760 RepID=A0A438KQX1_VITVI|nr:Protein FAR1-related sequence 7 [Vitis vinifera]